MLLTKRGSAALRKVGYETMRCIKTHPRPDDSVYQYIVKKEAEIKNEDMFDDIPCVVDYVKKIAEKKRNMEKQKSNLVNAVSDDNWGNPNFMEYDFSVEEMLDMPVMGDEMGEPKVSADKVQNPNNTDIADNESHDKYDHGIFCVTGKGSDCIDIEDLY